MFPNKAMDVSAFIRNHNHIVKRIETIEVEQGNKKATFDFVLEGDSLVSYSITYFIDGEPIDVESGNMERFRGGSQAEGMR